MRHAPLPLTLSLLEHSFLALRISQGTFHMNPIADPDARRRSSLRQKTEQIAHFKSPL